MVRVPEPKGISVRVPEISGWQNSEPYLNQNIRITEIRVPENFGSGFWLTNNPIFQKYFFPILSNNFFWHPKGTNT